ncbi:MAG: NfeD family protein [Eubacteriales bacterium]
MYIGDYFLSEEALWIMVLVICIIVEVATLGLATIWFAVGAIIAWMLALIGASLAVQITIFFVSSFILLYYTRPLAIKVFKIGNTKTNVESIVEKIGIVTEKIDNIKGTGLIKIDGQVWTARSHQDEIIEEDSIVMVKEVKGVKLYVIKK